MAKRQQAAAQGKGFGLLFEMGCGKTLTAIAIAGAAYEKGAIEKVLVVAPTSVCSVWPKEFKDYADFKYKVNVLLGDKKKRLQELEALNNFPFKALKVAVINYESTWREGLFEALLDWKPDMVIADESQRIKTPDAEQSKAMHQIGDIAKYKLILSGTPVQNDAIDLFSQYRFLNPNIFGVLNRNRSCIEMLAGKEKQLYDKMLNRNRSCIEISIRRDEPGAPSMLNRNRSCIEISPVKGFHLRPELNRNRSCIEIKAFYTSRPIPPAVE